MSPIATADSICASLSSNTVCSLVAYYCAFSLSSTEDFNSWRSWSISLSKFICSSPLLMSDWTRRSIWFSDFRRYNSVRAFERSAWQVSRASCFYRKFESLYFLHSYISCWSFLRDVVDPAVFSTLMADFSHCSSKLLMRWFASIKRFSQAFLCNSESFSWACTFSSSLSFIRV